MFAALPAPNLDIAHTIYQKARQSPMGMLTDAQTRAKLNDMAALLEEMKADGVRLAPGLTPEKLLCYEEAGVVLDLETGQIAGTDSERYALTAKGYSAL